MNPNAPAISQMKHELEHMSGDWVWFILLGALLAVCGTAAIVFPPVLVGTSIIVPVVLGVLLMVGGVATIISSFWAGKWSGFLLHLLVGILYVAVGFVFTQNPFETALALTLFIAIVFIIMGIFRTTAALVLRFPQWGWALLNGVITFLAGIIIYRSLPEGAFWVIGLLIGLELIFNGWMWIMLALSLRSLHLRHA
jgi:uncharacterized membrane protein HdeD (DUF308 family)